MDVFKINGDDDEEGRLTRLPIFSGTFQFSWNGPSFQLSVPAGGKSLRKCSNVPVFNPCPNLILNCPGFFLMYGINPVITILVGN